MIGNWRDFVKTDEITGLNRPNYGGTPVPPAPKGANVAETLNQGFSQNLSTEDTALSDATNVKISKALIENIRRSVRSKTTASLDSVSTPDDNHINSDTREDSLEDIKSAYSSTPKDHMIKGTAGKKLDRELISTIRQISGKSKSESIVSSDRKASMTLRISKETIDTMRQEILSSASSAADSQAVEKKAIGKMPISIDTLSNIRNMFKPSNSALPALAETKNKPEQAHSYQSLNLSPEQIRSNIQKGIRLKKSWEQAGKIFKNDSVSGTIDELSKIINDEIPMMMIENNLSLYCAPIWKTVNLEDFISEIRLRLSDHADVLGALSYQNFRELFLKVKTLPTVPKMPIGIHAPEHLINFIDGVYDMENRTFINSSPEHYFFTYVNANIDELGTGDGEIFKMFMDNCTGGDSKVYQAIMEMIGYAISSYMRKSFFILLGNANTGKSQIGELLKEIIGADNTVSILNLNSLKDPHTTARLKGKKVCLCMDMPKSSLTENAIATIKQVTGGDLIVGEKKYCNAESFENTAKLILACNNMPEIPDVEENEALLKRMNVIPMENPVPAEKQIPDIAKKMAKEKGYIIWEALQALEQLKKRNFEFIDFKDSLSCFEDVLSPKKLQQFLDHCCIADPESIVYTDDLYNAFLSNTGKTDISKITFSQKISKCLAKFSKIHTSRNGKTINGYTGLKLISLSQ